jgi:hypothetical protein
MDTQYGAIMTEISAIIDRKEDRGEIIAARWVAHEIVARNEPVLPDSDARSEFFRWTAYTALRDLVAKHVRDRHGDKSEGPRRQQYDLGFEREHLQDYYLVKRDGEEIFVPIVDLTDSELREKAKVYRKMGKTCFEHAEELDRYIQERATRDSVAA